MKKQAKCVLYVMAAVLTAAAVWFPAQDLQEQRAAGVMKALGASGVSNVSGRLSGGMTLTGWDISVSGVSLKGNLLTCSGGKDIYLMLDGAEVYLQQPEDGEGSCLKSSPAVLGRILSEQGEQALHLWLTGSGKVDQIAVLGRGV